MGKTGGVRAWDVALFVAFYGVFANLPFWVASSSLGILRNHLFCLEYAVVGLLALCVPQIFAAVLLLAVIVADLVFGVSGTYYLSPAECLRNARFLSEFSGTRFLAVVVVCGLALLVALAAAFFPALKIRGNGRLTAAACLVAFAAICVGVDSVTIIRGAGRMPNPFQFARQNDSFDSSYINRLRLCRVPVVGLMRQAIWDFRVRNKALRSPAQSAGVASASASALALRSMALSGGKGGMGRPNLVLALVESWGLSTDAAISSSLVRPYSQPELLARYDVFQGTVPFLGSTIEGEGRELCDSRIGFRLLSASSTELQECLPERLAHMGYHNVAVHGMDGHMFDRQDWYGSIGFSEEWFGNQLRQQGLPDCAGALTGTCDSAIAEWIGRRLEHQDTSPEFVYWVTLNSHLPVPTPAPLSAGESCSLVPELSQEPPLCSWYQLVSNVHHSLSRLAMTRLASPTVFVIVGDHAPPFSNPNLRSSFSTAVVPYVVLIPRRQFKAVSRLEP